MVVELVVTFLANFTHHRIVDLLQPSSSINHHDACAHTTSVAFISLTAFSNLIKLLDAHVAPSESCLHLIRARKMRISMNLALACLLAESCLGMSMEKKPRSQNVLQQMGFSSCQSKMVQRDSLELASGIIADVVGDDRKNHQLSRPQRLHASGMQRRHVLSSARTLLFTSIGATAPFVLSPADAQRSASAAVPSTEAVDAIVRSSSGAGPSKIAIPLEFSGDAYIVSYQVGGSSFRAVLDTGSPFLMIPGTCSENTRSKSGCYQQQGSPSGLEGTIEIFDGFIGEVEWRKGSFGFPSPNGSISLTSDPNADFIFGVVDDNIMSGPGGVFFGLIKNTAARIRPSFLGQTNVVSFSVDLRESAKSAPNEAQSSPSLTLSTVPLLSSYPDFIPLNYDLRKKYGDPVQHYVAKAKSLIIDGKPLVPKNGKPIYVILDTGVTGMVVNNELFEQRYHEARANKEKRLWGGPVEIMLETKQKNTLSISAQKPLTTRFDPKVNWNRFNANLMVVGLSFLNSRKMTVDIDDGKMWLEG